MDAKEIIARRIALELTSGDLVNLGIGLPTLVASYVPHGVRGLLPGGERLDRHATAARRQVWPTSTSPIPAAAS